MQTNECILGLSSCGHSLISASLLISTELPSMNTQHEMYVNIKHQSAINDNQLPLGFILAQSENGSATAVLCKRE